MHFRVASADTAAQEAELHVGVIGQQRHRHRGIGQALGNHQAGQAESRTGCRAPGCQIETFSACQVCTGPTVMACVGTSGMLPPPEVRAFWMMVRGCNSTTRVPSRRYCSGDRRLILIFARRVAPGR